MIALGCIFGILMAVMWALAMFTDTWPGRFFRKQAQWLGSKNSIALGEPSIALFFFAGSLVLALTGNLPDSQLSKPLSALMLALIFIPMIGVILSFFNFDLPKQMYPEWHEQQRALKASRVDHSTESGTDAQRSDAQ